MPVSSVAYRVRAQLNRQKQEERRYMAIVEVLVCLAVVSLTGGSPAWCPDCPEDVKRDIFMSRGWGASGMPFNYVYPKGSGPPRMPAAEEIPMIESAVGEPSAQFLTARLQSEQEGHAPAVPQLFVSYGWGPLGK